MIAQHRLISIGLVGLVTSLTWACGGGSIAPGEDCSRHPDLGMACTAGAGECAASGTMVCDTDGSLICDAVAGTPGDELCDNAVDDDCDGRADEGFDEIGGACTAGLGECAVEGTYVCAANGTLGCDGPVVEPAPVDMCDGRDEDCDGVVDGQCAYRSCAEALSMGETEDGMYYLSPDGLQAVPVYCDMTTDGGGWTLVGSTRSTPLDDQASAAYPDLATLAPSQANAGIWDGMRMFGPTMDVRVSCRATVSAEEQPFDVDLAFPSSDWYEEWTRGADAESCFSEGDGAGADPTMARIDYVTGRIKFASQEWLTDGYLEGEDTCDDQDDFTVDLADRGMAGNPDDGTDWGEADGVAKCGVSNVEGQWFVWVRPSTPAPELKVGVIEISSVADHLSTDGIDVTLLPYSASLPNDILTGGFNVLFVARYAFDWPLMTPELQDAIDTYSQAGGHIVTEWDGLAAFFSAYDSTFRYPIGAIVPFGWFAGQVGGGQQYTTDTPVTQVVPEDPLFEGVANPFSGDNGTQFFFTMYNTDPNQLEVLATFEGDGSVNYPAGSLATIVRGLRCGGNIIMASFDYQDAPTAGTLSPLVRNLAYAATYLPNGRVVDVCPF